jgi:acyl-CoA reductase-like NAD-dependent aldehyde dehydrogenase
MKLVSTNPSQSYNKIDSVDISTYKKIVSRVNKAHNTKKSWQKLGVDGRVKLLRKLSDKFVENSNKLAKLQSIEMGMPIRQARDDINFGIEYFNSYLDKANECLKPITTLNNKTEFHRVIREPYGVVACIVPWNYPFSNFVWQCGQNLVVGNTVVFKHSEETPLIGKLIEEIVCGVLPDGVFNEIYGDGLIGEYLIKQDINLICFTGSTKTGIKINEIAAGRLIPTSLELGGSAPGIIFEDANIENIKQSLYNFRFLNCGQACDALKRLIVHKSKIDEVVIALTQIISNQRIGVATDDKTDIGPLVSKKQLELLEAQINDAKNKGAKFIIGGKRPDGLDGAYYEPTLVINVKNNMRIWNEEVFGPVLPIVTFKTEAEAIELANETKYGLGAYIFTDNSKRFMRVANQIESGMVSQNNLSYVNINNPFTGYKMSGDGREHAIFGFDSVTKIKIITSEK